MKRRNFFKTLVAPVLAGACAKLLPRRIKSKHYHTLIMDDLVGDSWEDAWCSKTGALFNDALPHPDVMELQEYLNRLRSAQMDAHRDALEKAMWHKTERG